MLTRITRFGVVFTLMVAPLLGQNDPKPKPAQQKPAQQKPAQQKPAPKKAADAEKEKQAATGAESTAESGPIATVNDAGDQVKVLKPQDVPAELLRVKSKADIKAEVTIVPNHGRKVLVKGVIRNGKLIEVFLDRRFRPQKNIDHPRSGVRLWWVQNTAGWIFLRYSQIRSIALTGVLTAEEKRQIMDALKAVNQEKEEKKTADDTVRLEEQLKKMSPTDLDAYLLRQYPADKGWNHERLRLLKRKQIIDNQPLTREGAVFVSYYAALIKARLRDLKRDKKKVEFEPGSAEKKPESEGGPVEPSDGSEEDEGE